MHLAADVASQHLTRAAPHILPGTLVRAETLEPYVVKLDVQSDDAHTRHVCCSDLHVVE